MARWGSRRDGTSTWQAGAVVGLAVIVIATAGYVLTRTPEPPSDDVRYTPSETPSTEAGQIASIPKAVEVDFAKQRKIPDGYEVFETGLNESGMRIKGGRLVHGAPTDANGASYLETQLPKEATRIGAIADFADGDARPGAIALVIWEDSLVATRRNKGTLPRSGLHFVATPGQWHLGIIDPAAEELEDIVERGSYSVDSRSAKFDLFREGDTVWVVDPNGKVTNVSDPRISKYAGRWANWELYEPTSDSVPASFRKIWAG